MTDLDTRRDATRDFLNAQPAGPLVDETASDAALRQQYEALKVIRREIRKQTPDVLTSVVVGNTDHNAIADQLPRQVWFEISGKPVPIYKLFMATSLSTFCINLQNPPATPSDGFRLATNTLYTFDVEISTLYIRCTVNTANVVNGPQPSTGGLFLWGFTVPDPDAPDWE